jgi:hypothetical protein
MTTAEKNIATAINLAAHLNDAVESIRFEVLASTENGAALYRVENGLGEVRHVIEGETGEMLSLEENITDAEAIAEFNY